VGYCHALSYPFWLRLRMLATWTSNGIDWQVFLARRDGLLAETIKSLPQQSRFYPSEKSSLTSHSTPAILDGLNA